MLLPSYRASSPIQSRRTAKKAISALSILAALLSPASGLQVTPNSACASLCTDSPASDVSDPNLSNTDGSDVVCRDEDYSNSPVGYKFETCLNCLQSSSAVSSDENDQAWYFYNLRFALNKCIFGVTSATDSISTPCSTSTECGPLASALGDGMSTPSTTSQYSYCSVHENSFLGSSLEVCRECLRLNSDASYLSNFLLALQAGCSQRPASGMVIGLNSTLFTKDEVIITFPHHPTGKKKNQGLSTDTIIGIAVGCGVLLLLLIAAAFVCVRKRRMARHLRRLQSPLHERFGADNITAPHSGAYSSPQTSPPFKEESVPMSRAPKVRNFSFSRQRARQAEDWQGAPLRNAPPESYSSNPPLYSPPRSNVDPIPAHHAYIPPEYTPPSRSSISPISFSSPLSPLQPRPQPVHASHPQRSAPPAIPPLNPRNSLPWDPRAALGRNPSLASDLIASGHIAAATGNQSNVSVPLPSPPGLGQPRKKNSPSLAEPLPIPHDRNSSSSCFAPPPRPSSAHARNVTSASRLQTSNLGARRGFVPSLVQTGSEEDVRKNGERLYREGRRGAPPTGTEARPAVEGKSPESDISVELWPGSY